MFEQRELANTLMQHVCKPRTQRAPPRGAYVTKKGENPGEIVAREASGNREGRGWGCAISPLNGGIWKL